MDEFNKDDEVRHPWGVSRPWSVKGYTPQRWLSGPPTRANFGTRGPSRSLPPGMVLPASIPHSTTQVATNLAAPTEIVKEKEDRWRSLHVGAFVVLAISSFGSMLLSYKMYLDKKKREEDIVSHVSDLEEPENF